MRSAGTEGDDRQDVPAAWSRADPVQGIPRDHHRATRELALADLLLPALGQDPPLALSRVRPPSLSSKRANPHSGSYPTLLLLELLSGSRFSNLRLAYPLIRWRPLPLPPSSPLTPQSAVTLARTLAPRPPKVAQTPEGDWAYLVGTQEGEWMREWEGMVVDEVRKGRRGGVLRIEGSEESRRRGVGLRGYSTG